MHVLRSQRTSDSVTPCQVPDRIRHDPEQPSPGLRVSVVARFIPPNLLIVRRRKRAARRRLFPIMSGGKSV